METPKLEKGGFYQIMLEGSRKYTGMPDPFAREVATVDAVDADTPEYVEILDIKDGFYLYAGYYQRKGVYRGYIKSFHFFFLEDKKLCKVEKPRHLMDIELIRI